MFDPNRPIELETSWHVLSHQRHQSAATGHFQFAEDGMKMSFHRFKTQTSFIGNLLITAPVAYQTRQILFSTRQADQMRQRIAADLISCRCPRLKTLELDEKMRSREGGRTNLFQTDRRAKITSRRMPNCLVPKLADARPRGVRCSHRFLRTRH